MRTIFGPLVDTKLSRLYTKGNNPEENKKNLESTSKKTYAFLLFCAVTTSIGLFFKE